MITLQTGIDAMDFIKQIPDEIWEQIDTIVWDYPYYSTKINKKGGGFEGFKTDNIMINKKQLDDIYNYIKSKTNGNFVIFHTNIKKIDLDKSIIIWNKSNVPFDGLLGNCEFIQLDKKIYWKTRVLSIPNERGGSKHNIRQCAKPYKLFIELFKLLDSKFILDPFAGYGNSIHAAGKLGIPIYACDIDSTLNWDKKQSLNTYF